MATEHSGIDEKLADWIVAQHLFFVATAPLAADGLVNCSPKGLHTFAILGPRTVAYLDLTGSGVETISHVQENGRIVIMFCALEGAPKVVRLHGQGTVLRAGDADFEALRSRWPDYPGVRAIIRVDVTRVSDSCGFAVPRFTFVEDRDSLIRWAEQKGPDGLVEYRQQKNAKSLNGLPGLVVEKIQA
jgi:hypothetical protein